ncbi:MAG TPA: molybdenum cofactor biosynthesis protein MoaE [Longimicrobiales bacterium]|nr:molybdenum cofactor biosynthesis protein MoaE [Longimicrobiales bacterium]
MRTWITDEPIDVSDVLSSVGSDADGAALLFLGTVREQNEGRPVQGMRYDAYAGMAASVLSEIAGEAGERAGTDRISVVHRTGELQIGDVSVAIAVSSPHRAEAFDAARYVIEQIKLRLPVWKHEHYTDGSAEWLDGATPPAPAAESAAVPAPGTVKP